jgi:small subunit ribosomal protein S9
MSFVRSASSRLRRSVVSQRKALAQIASASTSTQSIPQSAPRLPPRLTQEEYLPTRVKPIPTSYYTARPTYIDSLILLEDLARRTKRALQKAHIPVTVTTDSTTNRATNYWLKLQDLSQRLGVPLKSSQYRHIVARLVVLSRYLPSVTENFSEGQCGPTNRALALSIEETLRNFSRNLGRIDGGEGGKSSQIDEFYSSSTHVDSLGRAYARGRRKESSARVWVVPKQVDQETETASLLSQSILINLQSLPQTFTRVDHREAVLYPLRLTGLLGVVNVFALVQGGGSTGQSGAIAHGIARAIVTHFDHQAKEAEKNGADDAKDVRLKAVAMRDLLATGKWFARKMMTFLFLTHRILFLLHADGVLIRDKRMVERKKTGLAKARKAYTWVKR